MSDGNGKGRVTHNISLDALESLALLRLARDKYADSTGNLRRGAISWVVVDLLDEKMRGEIGRDWRDAIIAEGVAA